MKLLRFIFRKIFLLCTGHTYTNLARLFLRMFVGIMMIQQGILYLEAAHPYRGYLEIACAVLIVIGLLTRIADFTLLIGMVNYVFELYGQGLSINDPLMSLSVTFCGVIFFMILSGPGKISLDYVLALLFLDTPVRDIEAEADLEEA